jgi:phosphoglycolate phosphatase
MPTALRAVLFDLDGTLIDTAPDFAFVIDVMRKRRQLAPVAYDKVRETVSDGARGLVRMAFGLPEDHAEFEPLRQEMLALYRRHLADNSHLFDGMESVLRTIEQRGLHWGVVTNKPLTYAEPLMQALALHERCAALICPDHVKERKPHPESLELACARIGCDTGQAIFVGDHRRDIEAGRNAGMNTVACAYGYVHADDPCEKWGADFIVQRVDDLLPLLRTMP